MRKIIFIILLSLVTVKYTKVKANDIFQVKEKTYTVVYQEMKDYGGTYNNPEEAEDAAIDELIQIVKAKTN